MGRSLVHPATAATSGQPGLPARAKDVIKALTPLLSEERVARIDEVVSKRIRSVVVVLEEMNDPYNASAVLRSAEAFGIQEVHFIERVPRFAVSGGVTQGSDRWLDIVRHDSAQSCVGHLHSRGYRVFVADGRAPMFTPLDRLVSSDKVAVVFGNEHAGASAVIRALADGVTAVPMRGFVESLNLSVAVAVTLHSLTAHRSGDLRPKEAELLRARYMCLSVRDAEAIVHECLSRVTPQ
ncbi:MAG: RNA methyltransferase [Myxococcales bacterium]|nr:RNA methyltransferase [Myxococcales bacterium]MCB9707571.1 RNA methyltransferase [Myxococcales bacterium]